jgi:hypothetical protein
MPVRSLAPLAVFAAFAASPARAATVGLQFDIDPTLAREAGVNPADVESEFRGPAEQELELDSMKEYLSQMANANAFSTLGMGVDYASNPQKFVAGASLGAASCGAVPLFVGDADLPATGYAAEASLMAGLNLGAFSKDESFLRRFVVSVNGLYWKGSAKHFDWTIYNYGAHLQFKLIRPKKRDGVVNWGGLDVNAGYQQAFYQLSLHGTYPITVDDLRWDAAGDMVVASGVPTIPLDVSTNLRILVVSVFAGGGIDIRTSGEATGTMDLHGDLYVTDKAPGDVRIGSVAAEMHDTAPANLTAPRVFAGVQVNVAPVKIYTQLNVGLDSLTVDHPAGSSVGAQLGVRVAM